MSEQAAVIPQAPPRGNGMLPSLRRWLMLSPAQATFAVRGFASADPAAHGHLEAIGASFIAGYNAAVSVADLAEFSRQLTSMPEHLRGFAVEGAAMGTSMTDAFHLGSGRLARLRHLFERDFTYLVHVGAGWALARVPWWRGRILAALDPILLWLAYDGLGFHDCFFHHRKVLGGWRRCQSGYAARAYDQGVGRALWFVEGGAAPAAAANIRAIAGARASDLFSGLGLAIAYAGPADHCDLEALLRLAGRERAALGQGIAFGCEARARAGHIPAQTQVAAGAIGFSATDLAQLVRGARRDLRDLGPDEPAYELWRRRTAEIVAHAMGERA